jgi:hypothetical protein
MLTRIINIRWNINKACGGLVATERIEYNIYIIIGQEEIRIPTR